MKLARAVPIAEVPGLRQPKLASASKGWFESRRDHHRSGRPGIRCLVGLLCCWKPNVAHSFSHPTVAHRFFQLDWYRGKLPLPWLKPFVRSLPWPAVLPWVPPPAPATLPSRRPLRIAHRGASGYAPENTWPAFQRALELDVDMVELDVRRTSDHELVVCHDAWLDRLTGVRVPLRRLSLPELREFEVGGESIPRLADVLPYLTSACAVNVELKERGLAVAAAAVVKALGVQERVVFSSFHSSELIHLKAIDRTLRVAVLVMAAPVALRSCLKLARLVQAEAISIAYNAFRRRLLRQAQAQGLKVYVWTVDDPEAIAHLRSLGVDGIMSNYPDRI